MTKLRYKKVYEIFSSQKETLKQLGNENKVMDYMSIVYFLSELSRFGILLKNF